MGFIQRYYCIGKVFLYIKGCFFIYSKSFFFNPNFQNLIHQAILADLILWLIKISTHLLTVQLYNCTNKSMNITVVSAEPIKVGGDLYKIVLELRDDNGNLTKRYEIWVLNSVIQYTMKIDISPAHKELARFGIEFFKQRIQETKFNIPENGAYISAKGVYFEDPIKFPELLKNAEIMIQ